jgi:RNA polymerase primary sigma factor
MDPTLHRRRTSRRSARRKGVPAAPRSERDSFSVYLEEAGRVPLLDAADEVRLARDLARSRSALRALARDLPGGRDWGGARHPYPAKRRDRGGRPEEVDRVYEDLLRHCGARRDQRSRKVLREAREHKRRLDRAREQLVRANLRLVVHIAKKYVNQGLSLLDLVQEGNLGLMKAVDRFSHRRGNRFSTYAYWWIKQSVERAISNQARTVRLPVHVQEKLRKVRQAAESLRAKRRREPTTEAIAWELRLPVAKIHEVLHYASDAGPLEDPDRALDHLRQAPDPTAVSPFERAFERQRRRSVEEALRPLTPQERQVIRLRFGLGCERRPTLESVGNAMDLSRERVRQIEQAALAKIGASPESEELVAFAEHG